MIADTLHGPISWKSGVPDIERFLDRLQGNILKFHGRSHVVHLFCRFHEDLKAEARSFMREQIGRVQSARDQLGSAVDANNGNKDPSPFVSVFLTKAGYDYFEVPPERQPTDASGLIPTFGARA